MRKLIEIELTTLGMVIINSRPRGINDTRNASGLSW